MQLNSICAGVCDCTEPPEEGSYDVQFYFEKAGMIWRYGAGSLPIAQLYPLPSAFDSAGDFPTYWVMRGPCQALT
jgi:hypothetical protein